MIIYYKKESEKCVCACAYVCVKKKNRGFLDVCYPQKEYIL